jgi:hypothetical protein
LTVVGRVTTYPIEANALGDAVLLAPQGLAAAASSDGFTSLALSAAGATTTEQLAAAIAPLIDGGIVQLSVYGHAQTPDEIANASSLRPVPWALVAFFGALAIAGVGHGIHTTRRRRGGDLAVLRALGFRPVDVRRSLSWQGACIAGVGLLAGIPLGVLTGRLAFRALTDDVGVEGGFVMPARAIAVVALIAVVAAVLLATAPGRRAGQLRVGEVLRSE